jgi:hypothetical protein
MDYINKFNMSLITTICNRHSGSADVASYMIAQIFEAFETQLLLKTVENKMQPYACQYALAASCKLGLYDMQGYDPKLDD